jgi:hypothetical protein
MDKFLDKKYCYAIVGASPDRSKFGYKVLMDLKSKGFKVVPINPRHSKIEDLACYQNLSSLKPRPDVVVVITPPEVSLKILEECTQCNCNLLWFQPGAENGAVIQKAKELGLKAVFDRCIMRETD